MNDVHQYTRLINNVDIIHINTINNNTQIFNKYLKNYNLNLTILYEK